MIEHIWSVACTRALIDKDSNNVTLSEVLEQLTVEAAIPRSDFPGGEPVLPIEFEIVSFWIRTNPETPAKGVARILIQPPGGSASPAGDPFDVDLSEYERLRTRSRFSGLPVHESGRYWFIVQQQSGGDWTEVARVPLQVSVMFPEANPAT